PQKGQGRPVAFLKRHFGQPGRMEGGAKGATLATASSATIARAANERSRRWSGRSGGLFVWRILFVRGPRMSRRNHQGQLAFRSASLKVRQKLRWAAAAIFFKFLGQLTGDTHFRQRGNFQQDVERFQQAMGGFKVDACFAACNATLQFRSAPTGFDRQESPKKNR